MFSVVKISNKGVKSKGGGKPKWNKTLSSLVSPDSVCSVHKPSIYPLPFLFKVIHLLLYEYILKIVIHTN